MSQSSLDLFTQGYIEALFADLPIKYRSMVGGGHMAIQRRFSDLAPEALERIIADCERYQSFAASSNLLAMCGKNLWKWRNEGRYGDRFPPLTVQLGDDGKVRFA